jgi:flagellar motility protein MotE (MotC chaperone)
MLLTKLKFVAGAVVLALLAGAFVSVYYKGKNTEKQRCLEEQAKVIQEWNSRIEAAEERNKKLSEDLAKTITDLENAKSSRVQRIIKYVEKDPDSNTIVFDADGLSILNEAQQGRTTNGK